MKRGQTRVLLGLWALILCFAAASAQEIAVSPNAAGGLAKAIAQAAAGDRLRLAAGRYSGNFVIDKPLALLGEPGAVLDGGGRGRVLTITAPEVRVSGLTVRGSGTDLTALDGGIFIAKSGQGACIDHNLLVNDAFGIWVDGAHGVMISANRVQGNRAIRSQDRGNGIHLFATQGAIVAANEVWEARDGIYIDTSNHNTLQGNHLHHLRYGIHYMYSYHNAVIDNYTHDTRTGYALMQSKFLTVEGNRSENDQNYGILLNFITQSTLRRNVVRRVQQGTALGASAAISGAEGKALFVYNSLYNTIADNLFAESQIGIHLTAGSEENTLYGNAFVANQVQVKYVANRSQEWSKAGQGNYWSNYLGWDRDGDGVGDQPFEPNDGLDRLLWKYPSAKVLMQSPAVSTLRWVQRQFPVLKPLGVRDSAPLMRLPETMAAAR